jgi:integrase
MKRGLTSRAIEAIKPGDARREVPDAYLPGLYFIVQPSGTRSWAVRYRSAGQSRKHTLGSYPAINLKAARELGAKALRAAAEGRDPGREKATAKADSVEAVIEQFLDLHCRRSNRPRTAEETERLLRLHVLPRWRRRTVHEITRRDVLSVLDRVIDGGSPVAANRALTAIKTLFNWCIQRDIIAVSPAAGVRPPTAEQSRDRLLTDAELQLLWKAADQIGFPFSALVQLLALTGQRRDEVARMTWTELDLKGRTWTLPPERTKNNQAHEVPLSDAVIAILGSLPRIKGSPFVLTTNGESPASNYGKNKRRLDALLPSDMPPWRLHDLRRTVASGLARLGVNLPVIEKVLNHSSGSFAGIVGVYQRHSFAEEKREALDKWAVHVTDLMKGTAVRPDRSLNARQMGRR